MSSYILYTLNMETVLYIRSVKKRDNNIQFKIY